MSAKSAAKVAPAEEPGTALTPLERAKVALNSPEHEKNLAELAKASVSITAITNAAGYQQCHAARMALKSMRVTIEKTGKEARADATAFSKAVIAEESRLIGIIEPEEARLERIQREWDDARRREKEAKEAAERQRVAAIQARIEEIRQYPLEAVDLDPAGIESLIKKVVDTEIDDTFAELKQQAEGAKATALIRLRAAHTKAVALEAEQQRLAVERAENERIRQENEARAAAERARLAEEERVAREAREREAAEQRTRLAEEERQAKVAREAEAARQAEVLRLQREENDRIERERREAHEAEERRLAAERAEAERIEAERRATAQAEEQRLAEERARLEREQEEFNRIREAGNGAPVGATASERSDSKMAAEGSQPRDAATSGPEATSLQGSAPFRPTDEAIIHVLTTTYNTSRAVVITWLASMDLRKAREATPA